MATLPITQAPTTQRRWPIWPLGGLAILIALIGALLLLRALNATPTPTPAPTAAASSAGENTFPESGEQRVTGSDKTTVGIKWTQGNYPWGDAYCKYTITWYDRWGTPIWHDGGIKHDGTCLSLLGEMLKFLEIEKRFHPHLVEHLERLIQWLRQYLPNTPPAAPPPVAPIP